MSSVRAKGAGPHPLLVAYLAQLSAHPLRTKAVTTGTPGSYAGLHNSYADREYSYTGVLTFLQEVLASHFAGIPTRRPPRDASALSHLLASGKVDMRAVKMFIYGFFISAPMGHYLVGALQKAFAGKTGRGARIGQIVANNVVVAPIQTTGKYLPGIDITESFDEVFRTVKGGFWSVIKIMWVSSPVTILFAQKFLAPELWVPFFNLVGFTLGTYFNTRVKQIRLATEKKKVKDAEDDRDKAQ
ncbi:hypothetical protein EWM64_g4250 [Hericium alpestre]|uniref:Peroxisomal membrane protein PMP22 n=1 Tax=Hericium alpestre TaxID=135208 RepID=A0A4Z0A011_9AGAM|nr:hypothetical protein EWM64_g4250 [Hericium alpestre]